MRIDHRPVSMERHDRTVDPDVNDRRAGRMTGRVGGFLLVVLVAAAVGAVPATAASQLAFTSTPPAIANHTSATFEFHGSSASAAFTCALDAAAASSCTSPDTVTGLSEGSHTFSVHETGAAAIPPISYAWTVDLTSPTTVITGQPPALTNSQTAVFTFTSPDLSATFQCSLNGSAAAPCTSPVVYSGLADATRSLLIQAVDPAGNVDLLSHPISWTVDATPPDTTLQNPGNIVAQDGPEFQFASTEPGSTFQCALDNQAFQACSSGGSVFVQHSGHHVFQVRAVDHAGNVDPTPASYAWTADVTPPKRPTVAIFPAPAAPRAHGAAARPAPTPQKAPTISVNETSPVAKLLGTARFSLTTKLHAQWSSDSSAKSFDVTVTVDDQLSTGFDATGDSVGRVRDYKRTKREALALTVARGTEACVTVDARDAVGNTSRSRTECTTIPASVRHHDQNSLEVRDEPLTAVPEVKDAKAFGGVYVELGGANKTEISQDIFGLDGFVSPDHTALIAQRCPTCGTVEFDYHVVNFDGFKEFESKPVKLATVNLTSAGHSGDFPLTNVALHWSRIPFTGYKMDASYLVIRAVTGRPRVAAVGFSR